MKTVVFVIAILLVSGCGPQIHNVLYHKETQKAVQTQAPIKRVAVMSSGIHIRERFPGGYYESVPVWSTTAQKQVRSALAHIKPEELEFVALDKLGEEKRFLLYRYAPLISRVSSASKRHSRGWDTWAHKVESFDYTVGAGLKDLVNDIDAILYFRGAQKVSATKLDQTKPSIYSYDKEIIDFYHLYLDFVLVEVSTGNILWANFDKHENVDTRNSNDLVRVLRQIFSSSPERFFAQKEAR